MEDSFSQSDLSMEYEIDPTDLKFNPAFELEIKEGQVDKANRKGLQQISLDNFKKIFYKGE